MVVGGRRWPGGEGIARGRKSATDRLRIDLFGHDLRWLHGFGIDLLRLRRYERRLPRVSRAAMIRAACHRASATLGFISSGATGRWTSFPSLGAARCGWLSGSADDALVSGRLLPIPKVTC